MKKLFSLLMALLLCAACAQAEPSLLQLKLSDLYGATGWSVRSIAETAETAAVLLTDSDDWFRLAVFSLIDSEWQLVLENDRAVMWLSPASVQLNGPDELILRYDLDNDWTPGGFVDSEAHIFHRTDGRWLLVRNENVFWALDEQDAPVCLTLATDFTGGLIRYQAESSSADGTPLPEDVTTDLLNGFGTSYTLPNLLTDDERDLRLLDACAVTALDLNGWLNPYMEPPLMLRLLAVYLPERPDTEAAYVTAADGAVLMMIADAAGALDAYRLTYDGQGHFALTPAPDMTEALYREME